MNKKEDSLFKLIKSLNRSEKGYFKKFASLHGTAGKSAYLKLFEAIDRLKEYDEDILKKKLRGESLLRYLASSKNYLFRLILRALNAYHSSINKEKQISELLFNADILFKKRFYKETRKLLDRANKLAEDQCDHLLKLAILHRQRRLIHRIAAPDEIKSFINDYSKKSLQYLSMEENMIHCAILRTKTGLYSTLIGKATYPDSERKAVEKEARALENKNLSFYAKRHLYDAYMFHYQLKGDYTSSRKYAQKHIALLEANEGWIKEWPELYISTLHNLMYQLICLEEYGEFWRISKKLSHVVEKYALVCHEIIEEDIFKTYALELDVYILRKQFSEGIASIKERRIESKIRYFEKNIDPQHLIVLYFNLACVYFGAGDLSSSLKWLSLLFNDKDLKNLRIDFQRMARILNLIIHVERGHLDTLADTVKSAHRYFLKQNQVYKYESIITDYFYALPRLNTHEQKLEWFLELGKKLVPLKNDPEEGQMLKDSMVLLWIEGKIKKLQKHL